MLVLEATSVKQGLRHDDYHWCDDGELAYKPGIDCSCPDCGCNRGWSGLLMKTLQRDHYKPFRKISTRTARQALDVAREVQPDVDPEPTIAWPRNRALLDFIADHMIWE